MHYHHIIPLFLKSKMAEEYQSVKTCITGRIYNNIYRTMDSKFQENEIHSQKFQQIYIL
jgi:hypothetical protein